MLVAPALLCLSGVAALNPLAPLPPDGSIVSTHAPYEAGSCQACHERDAATDPGKVVRRGNAVCAECHAELNESVAAQRVIHMAASDGCTNCHNPHNARQANLMLAPLPTLCVDCHDAVEREVNTAKIRHGAATDGRSCLNCHSPHASNVESLLLALPYDLCIRCHGVDDLRDDKGRLLGNIKTLLAENPRHHGPVVNKDCGACHSSHGSDHFRLLRQSYPAKFYSAFDEQNYALCFRCHNDKLVKEARTTKLTRFRAGDKNLHYLHVHQTPWGRTCRACHEVHAAKQPHQIRDGVPYGTGGWVLPVVYTPSPEGGTCEKTCHPARSYGFKVKSDKAKR